MRAAASLGGFAVALAAAFGASFALGRSIGPVAAAPVMHHEAAEAAGSPELVLLLDRSQLPRGPAELGFRVASSHGEVVTAFTKTHDKELHLIVVRQDGTGYQHLHPVRDSSGHWRTPIRLPDAGAYRVFADGSPGGRRVVLSADLAVPGPFQPRPLPTPARTASVDGFEVSVRGELRADEESTLSFTVTRAGRPAALERYLGADGHLVSLREGDLSYLHTHPVRGTSFDVDVPTAGRYLLFFDFQVGGVVRTATFTASAS